MAEIDEKIAEAWAKSGLTLDAGPHAAFNAGYGMAAEHAAVRITDLEARLADVRSCIRNHGGSPCWALKEAVLEAAGD